MVEIIRRRWSGLEIILAPVLVQGEEAPKDIARGIELLNQHGGVELIIVGRGGGSLEDLWAFNTEIVARSIYQSVIPVISAVGHETDFTIADFVADCRAATPSAAAELATPEKNETARRLRNLTERMERLLETKIKLGRQRLQHCQTGRLYTKPAEVLCRDRRQQTDFLRHRLSTATKTSLGKSRNRLTTLAASLNTISPLATLARGYSICTDLSGERIILDVTQVRVGEKLKLNLHKGTLGCLVENTLVE
jgi:exodeoxyribonuclease VII large subunit